VIRKPSPSKLTLKCSPASDLRLRTCRLLCTARSVCDVSTVQDEAQSRVLVQDLESINLITRRSVIKDLRAFNGLQRKHVIIC